MAQYSHLKKVSTYAASQHPPITPQYIHLLVNLGRMEFVIIDNVLFIDTLVYPKVPAKPTKAALAAALKKTRKRKKK